MSTEKIFCGSGRILKTSIGEIPKFSFSKKDINTIVDYMKTNKLEWINLEMLAKKNVEENKPTHYICVDTYKKDVPQAKKSDELPY